MTERKGYKEEYKLGEVLYRLFIVGGPSFLNLTDAQVRQQLSDIDPEDKLVRGKDYIVEPIQDN